MLPQTRQKLRWFALVSLISGCALVAVIWLFSEPVLLVKGATEPTFWQVLVGQPVGVDEIKYKLMDMEMDFGFFSDILQGIIFLTVIASALSLVVIFNDIRLTKK